MSTIADAIYARLTGFAGLAALVGTRVYPNLLPQKPTLPGIVFQRVSGERVRSMSGPSALARPRYQVDCYATAYEDADAVAKQVRLALDGWRDPGATVSVEGSSLEDDRDFYEPETKLHRVSADYLIWHVE